VAARAMRAPWTAAFALALLAPACAGQRLAARKAPVAHVAGVPKGPPAPTPTPTPVAVYPQTRPIDESLPVKIRSRTLRFDKVTQETVFYGGVTVTQDTTTMRSQELRSQNQGHSARASGNVDVDDENRHFRIRAGELDYADSMREATLADGVRLVTVDPYAHSVTVTGDSGACSGSRRWAQVAGRVDVVRGPLKARALTATVEEGGERLTLEKSVHTRLGFNRMQSDLAVFDQKEHSVELEGKVRMRMIPEELRLAAAQPWNLSDTAKEAQ